MEEVLVKLIHPPNADFDQILKALEADQNSTGIQPRAARASQQY